MARQGDPGAHPPPAVGSDLLPHPDPGAVPTADALPRLLVPAHGEDQWLLLDLRLLQRRRTRRTGSFFAKDNRFPVCIFSFLACVVGSFALASYRPDLFLGADGWVFFSFSPSIKG